MIVPHFSYLLAGLIPQAKIKIYPDAAHGFLFQHATSSPPTSTHSSTTASQIKPKLLQIRAMTCEPTLLPAGQDNPSRSRRFILIRLLILLIICRFSFPVSYRGPLNCGDAGFLT